MHVNLVERKKLPHKPPHLILLEGITYPFARWHKQTMVYTDRKSGHSVRVQTSKIEAVRFVRKILRTNDGKRFACVDAYRNQKTSSGRSL